MTNQERLNAIESHPKFNMWAGRDAFLDKVSSWRDPISQNLLEDPVDLTPTMSRSTYHVSLLTTGNNPQVPEVALPRNKFLPSNHALVNEIEQTLFDAENALRALVDLRASQQLELSQFDFKKMYC